MPASSPLPPKHQNTHCDATGQNFHFSPWGGVGFFFFFFFILKQWVYTKHAIMTAMKPVLDHVPSTHRVEADKGRQSQ
jgi:hypothetical protein